MLKCRDLYLEEVNRKVERYRIENMKKITMEKFDEIEVGCDLDQLGEGRKHDTKREKLYKWHQYLM